MKASVAAKKFQPVIQRVSHAEHTRQDILAAGVQLAAVEGLEALSIGRLADAVGMSRGGVFAHFGSKEAMQLAIVEAAFAQFVKEVVEPAMAAKPGVGQLDAIGDSYFEYVRRRAEQGGCFFTAASAEMDDRPGPVREQILAVLEGRRKLVHDVLSKAKARREISGDVEQLTFEVIALGTGAVMEFQLTKDPKVLERARTAMKRALS
ncbi:MAG: TetR/AcrR family transcriptional regulator [Myxococcaceae bacterium]